MGHTSDEACKSTVLFLAILREGARSASVPTAAKHVTVCSPLFVLITTAIPVAVALEVVGFTRNLYLQWCQSVPAVVEAAGRASCLWRMPASQLYPMGYVDRHQGVQFGPFVVKQTEREGDRGRGVTTVHGRRDHAQGLHYHQHICKGSALPS
jgi:hypothetical protein